MDLGPHAGFIIAAYATAALVVIGLIAWVLADHRDQVRTLERPRSARRRAPFVDRMPHERRRAQCQRKTRITAPAHAAAARAFSRPHGFVFPPPRRRRCLAHSLRADRAPGAGHRPSARAGPRTRRQAGSRPHGGRLQGRRHASQRLGVVVRAVPRGGAAADAAQPQTSASASSASTTRTSPRTRAGSSAATATRSRPPAPTAAAAPRWNGGFMACRRPSSSAATPASRSSWSAPSPRRISPPCSSPRSRRRWRLLLRDRFGSRRRLLHQNTPRCCVIMASFMRT